MVFRLANPFAFAGPGVLGLGLSERWVDDLLQLVDITASPDFPAVGAIQPAFGGELDAWLAALSPTGGVAWSTFYGGTRSERGRALAVNAVGTGAELFARPGRGSGHALPSAAGTRAAVLSVTRTDSGGTDEVWFYDVRADGFSLDDKRTPVEADDLPDVLERWQARTTSERERTRTEQSFTVPKVDIVA